MSAPEIRTGYAPGLLGAIAAMHARFYSANWNFGSAFEATVARGVADFLPRLGSASNEIWHVADGQNILGSIAIDGEDLGENRAHLRWFIMDDALRGTGLGTVLLDASLTFCDEQAFPETHLWTFQGLDTARRLYESRGFQLAEEYDGDQWGTTVREQRFVRPLP
jgi:GNAT superfamily N-acetyltransferase